MSQGGTLLPKQHGAHWADARRLASALRSATPALLFGVRRYARVIAAYMAGLEARITASSSGRLWIRLAL